VIHDASGETLAELLGGDPSFVRSWMLRGIVLPSRGGPGRRPGMKMTLLGSGVRAPFVLRGLAAGQDDLGLDEVVLHDTDPERLELMAVLGTHLCAGWGAAFTVRGEPDPRAAIEGARFVFSAIRPGQEGARAVDEEVPLKHGVLGQETTGPGGFAMALRTIPAMLGYARLIEEEAPGALLVNFTNPVGIVMQALHDHSSVRAVGICDGPVSMQRSVAVFLGLPREQVHADYFGLNHCGWIHRVLVDGRDRMPELLARFEELQAADEQWRLFDPGLVRSIGMLPMEYLYFYYYRDEAVAHIRGSGSSRGRQLQALNDALWPVLRRCIDADDLPGARIAWEHAMGERDATYFARERGELVGEEERAEVADAFEGEGYGGVATAVMAATVQRRKVPLILNVANRGAIGGLRDDDVVEVTCLTDEHGAHPLAQGEIPEAALALIRQVKVYERLTVTAAVEGSYDAALGALLAHPLVGSYPTAKAILDGYVEELAGALPPLG
jgi:6-phospho-beta-glucosidase